MREDGWRKRQHTARKRRNYDRSDDVTRHATRPASKRAVAIGLGDRCGRDEFVLPSPYEPRSNIKLKARLGELGGTALAFCPAGFRKLFAENTDKWGKVVRSANIKLELSR